MDSIPHWFTAATWLLLAGIALCLIMAAVYKAFRRLGGTFARITK